MNDPLVLYVGDTSPFDVFLVDSNGIAEDLSTAEAATLRVATDLAATSYIIEKTSTDAVNPITIDTTNSKLVVTLSTAQADALTAGEYIGQAAVRFGASSPWKVSQEFRVTIRPTLAARAVS